MPANIKSFTTVQIKQSYCYLPTVTFNSGFHLAHCTKKRFLFTILFYSCRVYPCDPPPMTSASQGTTH